MQRVKLFGVACKNEPLQYDISTKNVTYSAITMPVSLCTHKSGYKQQISVP